EVGLKGRIVENVRRRERNRRRHCVAGDGGLTRDNGHELRIRAARERVVRRRCISDGIIADEQLSGGGACDVDVDGNWRSTRCRRNNGTPSIRGIGRDSGNTYLQRSSQRDWRSNGVLNDQRLVGGDNDGAWIQT